MASECGTYIGKGTVNYPCTLPQQHKGPHTAMELPRTIEERRRWEQDQREAQATKAHVESGLGEFQGRAETTAQRYTENPTDHPSVVKQREEDAIKAADFRRGADAAVTMVCKPCQDGQHSQCYAVTDNIGAVDANDFMDTHCGCYARNADDHSAKLDIPCTACNGGGQVQAGSGVFSSMMKKCGRCSGTGVEPMVALDEIIVAEGAKLAEPTKQREGDQPLPQTSDRPFIQDAVIADIEARKQVGIQRYGTPLQAFNGRNTVLDWYEELLDAATYGKQLLTEREEMRVAFGAISGHVGATTTPSDTAILSALGVLARGLGVE